MIDLHLPEQIQHCLEDAVSTLDTIGCSQSQVLLYPDKVLKVQPVGEEAQDEHRMLSWLHGKLPVPEILAYEEMDGTSYLLMTRLPGNMACHEAYMQTPQRQAEILADGLKRLWSVDISDCPVNQCLDRKLVRARYNIAHGLADFLEPQGFESPQALLDWLQDNRPPEEPVLSHGDFCLPNIFFSGNTLSGFLDLPRCGTADKWCDIALCLRSLRDNYAGKYGKAYPGYSDTLLFEALGIEPDWQKIRYYILLDELY